MGGHYLLTEKRMKNLFDLNTDEKYDELNYFQIITLLYYIENNNTYSEIKQNVERTILERYKNDEDMFAKSELMLMLFDVICCPFVSDRTKRNLITLTSLCTRGESIASKITEITNKKRWFVDWDTNIDLERILKKKEWSSSY